MLRELPSEVQHVLHRYAGHALGATVEDGDLHGYSFSWKFEAHADSATAASTARAGRIAMAATMEEEDEVTEQTIGATMEVHRTAKTRLARIDLQGSVGCGTPSLCDLCVLCGNIR